MKVAVLGFGTVGYGVYEMLKNAGLVTPFDEACLKEVCETATEWLQNFDLTGIE